VEKKKKKKKNWCKQLSLTPKRTLTAMQLKSALRMLRMKCKLKVWHLYPGKNLFNIKIETISYL